MLEGTTTWPPRVLGVRHSLMISHPNSSCKTTRYADLDLSPFFLFFINTSTHGFSNPSSITQPATLRSSQPLTLCSRFVPRVARWLPALIAVDTRQSPAAPTRQWLQDRSGHDGGSGRLEGGDIEERDHLMVYKSSLWQPCHRHHFSRSPSSILPTPLGGPSCVSSWMQSATKIC